MMRRILSLVLMVWGFYTVSKGLPTGSVEVLEQLHLTGQWVGIVIGGSIALFGWSLWGGR